MSDAAVATLKQWGEEGKLAQATLTADGTSLTLGDVTLNASDKCSISFSGKTCEYSLASLFLQILDPEQSLPKYRIACKKHKVKDFVKALDKGTVVGFFTGKAAEQAAAPEPKPAAAAKPPAPSKESSTSSSHRKQRDHHDKHKRDKRHKKRPSSSGSSKSQPKQKVRKTINTEKLFTNLIEVVDKRSKEDKRQNENLLQALSPEGFGITPELLAESKESTQSIVGQEIPVGNSASILKAAAGKDLSRILKLYMESVQTSKKKKSSEQQKVQQKKSWRTHLIGKKPVIILPKGMTAPLTMINAHEFFCNSKFVPRDVMLKQVTSKANIPTTFSRRVGQRLGGGTVEYELMDNPKVKLPRSKDWDRVVAVVALGHSWQFKDWPGHYSNPVRLFGSAFGFYVGMEGNKIPSDLQGWSCVQAKLNRDKRGLDSVTHASFWNGLDEFMAIHKPELLPQDEV